MTIRTLLLFLIGDRQAILTIASDRRAIWVGLLFVLSAGFAREYDGQDLLHDPWHLLVPLAASLGSSFLLYCLLYLRLVWTDPSRPLFFTAYRSFLTVFWMTAPLAWLYAVPYERFMSLEGAMTANLITLGVVAAWRVALMVRVAGVLMGYGPVSSLFLVMTFANAVALIGLAFLPSHLFATMGGVRYTSAEVVLIRVANGVGCCGGVLMPVWLIGGIVVWRTSEPAWQLPRNPGPGGSKPSRGLWALGIASVAVWALVLPRTQAEQLLRRRVENEFRGDRVEQALVLMSAHAREDFPPHWEPPRDWYYFLPGRGLAPAMEVIIRKPVAPWVRDLYLTRFREHLKETYFLDVWDARMLLELPEGPTLRPSYRQEIRDLIKRERNRAAEDQTRRAVLLNELDELEKKADHLPP